MVDLDQKFMWQAIELAQETFVQTLPNPKVACVIVNSEGQVVGHGVHGESGDDHAEVIALQRAGRGAVGAIAYVTLEPCGHFGKTGPCVDALLTSGIVRVVYAVKDPLNGGAQSLRDKGIEVSDEVLEKEAQKVLNPWLHHITCATPFVTLKIASTLDGYIAARDGTSKWITSAESRNYVQKIRLEADAVVTTTLTVKHDNPHFTVRDYDVRFQPHVYVVGTSTLENFSNIDGKYTSISTRDPEEVMTKASADGRQHLLIEAGGHLASAFLQANLINRIIWMRAPILLGDGTPAIQGLGISTLKDALKGHITEHFVLGEDHVTVLQMQRCSH